MPVSVDIVLPCYNPNDNWFNELLAFHYYVNGRYDLNYILVNDGSSANKIPEHLSVLTAKNIRIDHVSYPVNKGKGYALRQGVAKSKSDYIVYTDIDFPFTNESTFGVMETLINKDADIVAGYRDRNYYQKKMSGFRKVLSKLFRFFIKDVLNMIVTDTQCGLKGFNTKGKQKFLSTRINRYLFDFEFIYLSSKDKHMKIVPFAVQLKDNVVFSKMKPKVLVQETFNLLKVLLFRKR